jgi:hypothetical protein
MKKEAIRSVFEESPLFLGIILGFTLGFPLRLRPQFALLGYFGFFTSGI